MNKNKGLVEAVIAVMEDCKTIDKSMTVGKGKNSYKGVSDADVKMLIGSSMRKNGLIILPVDVEPKVTISSWETTDYSGNPTTKFSYFTEVKTKYKLIHSSGESEIISGYGHGTDPSDKGAGKATTYALKYSLLYTFLVATGAIDDTDNTHSDEAVKRVSSTKKTTPPSVKKEALSPKKESLSDERFQAALTALRSGKATYERISSFDLSVNQLSELNKTVKEIEELSK